MAFFLFRAARGRASPISDPAGRVKNRVWGRRTRSGVFWICRTRVLFARGREPLRTVPRPSARRRRRGAAVLCRQWKAPAPVLVEIQALVRRRSPMGTPRRAVIAWDGARLSNGAVAVLEAAIVASRSVPTMSIFNVAGGYRISETPPSRGGGSTRHLPTRPCPCLPELRLFRSKNQPVGGCPACSACSAAGLKWRPRSLGFGQAVTPVWKRGDGGASGHKNFSAGPTWPISSSALQASKPE